MLVERKVMTLSLKKWFNIIFKKNSSNKVKLASATNEEVDGLLAMGVPGLLDLIAPDHFDRTNNTYFKVGSYFVKTIFITGLPREIDVGWLNSFLNNESDLDLSVHISPYPDRNALHELSKMITKIETEKRYQHGNINMIGELEQGSLDLQSIRRLIQNNRSRLFRVSVQACLYSKDLEQLERTADFLEGKLAGQHIHTRFAEGRMDEGYFSVAPLGINLLEDTYRLMDTYALGTILPFITADITHDNGFPFCTNLSTGAPVFLDHYDASLDNHNCVVLAMSGAGKSTAVKVKAGRSCFVGERPAIIDVQGEYSRLVKALGGIELIIGPESQTKTNPCEIEAEYDEKLGRYVVRLLDKYNTLVDLIGVMVGGLTSVQEAIIEEAIREVYTIVYGFTSDPESLYEKKSEADGRGLYKHAVELKKMPRLRDIVNRIALKGDRVKDIVDALRGRYLENGSLGFFDCDSNISLKDLDAAPIISFNLFNCADGQPMRLAMQAIAQWVLEKFIKRGSLKQKKRIIFDEAHNMLNDEFSARFLEKLVRQVRKSTCGIDVISQEARKFAEHEKGRAVIENCSTKLFLKQDDTTIDSLKKHFKLSEGICSLLTSFGKGQGILMVGKKAAAIKIEPTEMEKQWVYTSALMDESA